MGSARNWNRMEPIRARAKFIFNMLFKPPLATVSHQYYSLAMEAQEERHHFIINPLYISLCCSI